MNNKNKELLQKQFEFLLEESKNTGPDGCARLTECALKVYIVLNVEDAELPELLSDGNVFS